MAKNRWVYFKSKHVETVVRNNPTFNFRSGPKPENQYGGQIQYGGQNGCQLFLTLENQLFQWFLIF